MTKRLPLYLIAAIMATCLTVACNGDDSTSYYYTEEYYTNCGITSFGLAKDDSILRNLDSVYFSIDLVQALVFNADSLPPKTDISRLIPTVSATAASQVEFTFKSRHTAADTTVNFTTNPTDSINFSSPVTMTVTANDGITKRNYTIMINVHNVEPDTLYWNTLEQQSFPLAAKAQRTVLLSGRPVTLIEGTDGSWSICTTTDPETYPWATATSPVPAGTDINTFAATTDGALYIATTDGELHRSTDKGASWASTATTMHCVYGGYGTTLLGARHDVDGWKHVTYPASTEIALADGCPVSGTSQLVNYESKWSSSPMALMVGGIDADGNYIGDSWAYDGTIWHRISSRGIDERAGVTLVPYTTPVMGNGAWRVTDEDALLAMGGTYKDEDGVAASKTVYISYDFGLTWAEADDYLQFPADFPDFYAAQAYNFEFTLSSRSTTGTIDNWQSLKPRHIPAWASPVPASAASRIASPVTSWECPYIFLYGGMSSDGTLRPYVTRGVINRFTFKPIY